MVRSYILTKHEREILKRALGTGDKLDGYAVLTHHLRRAQKQLKEDLDLIQKALSTDPQVRAQKLMDLTLLTDQELAAVDKDWTENPNLLGRQNPTFSAHFQEQLDKEKRRRHFPL